MIRLCSGELALGGGAEFSQQLDQRAAFGLRQALGGAIHGVLVAGELFR